MEITVEEFAKLKKEDYFLLDVRTPEEYKLVNIGGENIPDYEIIKSEDLDIPTDKKIIVLCHHGMRSANITHFLLSKNYQQTYNLKGGIDQYSIKIDNNVRRY